ncbi:hypothetical protein [Janthinobacterium sp. P210005]|uniref:hypothetical protein n=1 Tax=Janthinobacterium sp. P210005 TaxID=3112938 RepID=UPI002E27293A|nr:hypothetical protein [Janthinobacterium sp. P210005]
MPNPAYVISCLRMLLLPMRVEKELQCSVAFEATLVGMGIIEADFRAWVELQTGTWRDSGAPSAEFCIATQAVLRAADSEHGLVLADKYFIIHRQLISEHFMSHEEARAFLTNAFLMADLAQLERLSGAQISRLLSQGHEQLKFSRQSVGYLLESLGRTCSLSVEQVKLLYQSDTESEISVFADSDMNASAEIVAGSATLLGFPYDIKEALGTLCPADDLAYFPPYLQILHYQCTIAEFYDHAATDMYEFSPRGNAALWLFAQYPDALSTAGNPYLNNLKSVGNLDDSWVRSKKLKARPGAKSLLDILKGLESLRFAARRELAKILRLWLHRIMRLSAPLFVPLPDALTPVQVSSLLRRITLGNTATFGVLEQRVVDAISSSMHLPADGWRSRGLGDSVNTTNVSRRKLGDCDFQDAANRKIIAYESHGGELTDVYVDEHLRTLSKVISLRSDELQGVAELAEWNLTVVFSAHRISLRERPPIKIGGVMVTLKFETFTDFIEVVDPVQPDWDMYLLTPLKQSRTPNETREIFREMAEII